MSTHRSVGLNLNKVQNFPFATIQIAKTWWSLGGVDRTYIVIEFKRGSSLVELECRSQISLQLLSIVKHIWLNFRNASSIVTSCELFKARLRFGKGARSTPDPREWLKSSLELLMSRYMGVFSQTTWPLKRGISGVLTPGQC